MRAEAAALDVTRLLTYDPDRNDEVQPELQSGIAVRFTSTQTSITIDRHIEPEFAVFVKDNSDFVLSDLRTKFENFKSRP